MSDFDPIAAAFDDQPADRRLSFDDRELLDFKWLMGSRRGRRIMWSMLDKTGVNKLSFTGDAATTFFNEGRRNVGLALTALITSESSEQYALMLQEHQEDVRRNADDPAR